MTTIRPVTDHATEEIVDVVFSLSGGRLAIDHGYALFSNISTAMPWFADEPCARVHQIHTAADGSGWRRPEDASGQELLLPRRTKLRLRVPLRRARDTLVLSGRQMDFDGNLLTPGTAKVVSLAPASTLLARHVVYEPHEDESLLTRRLTQMLHASGVNGARLICGLKHRITTPETVLLTCSLVVANLEADGAMLLLRNGIGPAGKLGCGVFLPYKHIEYAHPQTSSPPGKGLG